MEWIIIKEWVLNKQYLSGDYVIFDDIIYQANQDVKTENVNVIISNQEIRTAPYNLSEWDVVNNTIFWSYNTANSNGYNNTINNLVFNSGNYYFYDPSGQWDFWNPDIQQTGGYSNGDHVLYRGEFYRSLINNNIHLPNESNELPRVSFTTNLQSSKWVKVRKIQNSKWKPVSVWSSNKKYLTNTLVYHDNSIWNSTIDTDFEEEPGNSNAWVFKHTFNARNVNYQPGTINSIVFMNNEYYLILNNPNNKTLDNGINIFINKKWKNILVNIYISDNTLPNITNSDRDELYQDIYKDLTANNLMKAINNPSERWGFFNFLNYIIIEEDGSIKTYNKNENFEELPYYLSCENPDPINVKVNSLIKKAKDNPKVNPVRKLSNNKISENNQINWYNNSVISYEIIENKDVPKVFDNLRQLNNITNATIYRFSGHYEPIFTEIDLFKKGEKYKKQGNYKFNTELTNFGKVIGKKIRKVSRNEDLLKINRIEEEEAIYPMIDEFGLSVRNRYIFKPTWDNFYYTEFNRKKVIADEIEDIENNEIIQKKTNIGRPKLKK